MRITTKGRYAVRAVVNLALSEQKRPIPIKQIAGEEHISPEFLEQIFFRLKKSGIISSVRGPGGGFMLSKQPADITIRDIFLAAGEGLDLTPCVSCSDESQTDCDNKDDCVVFVVWNKIGKQLNHYLKDITLEKIISDKQNKFYESMPAGQDFSI